jgi:hypothetical protein
MNIIFGDAVQQVPDSFTVLELDTFRKPPDMLPMTAYCLIEKIPLQDFPLVETHKQLHTDVIANFKKRHWAYCEQAIADGLMGKWNGELDSFYENLLQRIGEFKQTPPADDWDGTLIKAGK